MKTAAKKPAPAAPTAKMLVAQLVAAHRQASETKMAAHSAKANFKRTRKIHRQAKQLAKEARKAFKALKKKLQEIKEQEAQAARSRPKAAARRRLPAKLPAVPRVIAAPAPAAAAPAPSPAPVTETAALPAT